MKRMAGLAQAAAAVLAAALAASCTSRAVGEGRYLDFVTDVMVESARLPRDGADNRSEHAVEAVAAWRRGEAAETGGRNGQNSLGSGESAN